MRSHGLSWVEIAKALGEPKNKFHSKENVHAESFVFFCHAPFFENGCLLFSFNSYFFKKFLDIDTAALYWPQVDLCFIFAVIVLLRVSHTILPVILFAGVSISTIWRRRIYHEMERRKHYGRRKLVIQELMDIVAEIRSRSVNAGIIMIEGELAARSLYSRRSASQRH